MTKKYILLLDGGGDFRCKGLELLGTHLHVVREAEVTGFVEGYEVYMCVWHVDAHHSLADLDARAHLLEALGNALCEEVQLAEELIVEVEDVVDLFLGDAEHMTAHYGVDIEESQAVVGLGDTVTRDFARNDFTEDACHGYRSILVSSNVILPAGTFTSTRSPTLWPRKAEAKGDVMLILPCLRLASLSGTMV